MKKCPTIKVLNLCDNKLNESHQRTSTRNSLSDLFMKTSNHFPSQSHGKYKFQSHNRKQYKQMKPDSQSNTDRQQQHNQNQKLKNKECSNFVSGIVTPLGQNKHKSSNSIGKSGSLRKFKYDSYNLSPHIGISNNTFNIRTYIRLRPFTLYELKNNPTTIQNFELLSKTSLRIGDNAYNFNRIFQIDNSQRDVYDECGKQVISKFLQGYNCTVFAYGQTGSGKTYTMFGDGNEGLVPFAVKDIFLQMQKRQSESLKKQNKQLKQKPQSSIQMTPSSKKGTKISCSMLQIYKQNLIDLLITDTANPPQLKIKQTPSGLHVNNLTIFPVKNQQQLFQLLYRGSQIKKMRQTNLNQQSSRSHLIFTIYLETQLEDSNVRFNKLNLIDLAGSEKVSKSKVQGQGLEEAKKINYSLSCLGNTINALVKHHEHIPFRQSKLTRLLQDSFTGNSLTSLVITCSIHESCIDETISSLKFGTRASKVRTFADIDQNVYNQGDLAYNINKNLSKDRKKKKVQRFVYDSLKQKYQKLQSKVKQIEKIIQEKYLNLVDKELRSPKLKVNNNNFDFEFKDQPKYHCKAKSVPYQEIKLSNNCQCLEQELEFLDQLLKKIRSVETIQQSLNKTRQRSLANSTIVSCNKKKELDTHIQKITNKGSNINSLASPSSISTQKLQRQKLEQRNKIITLTFQNTETDTLYEPKSQKLFKRVDEYLNQYQIKQQLSINEEQQPPIIKRQYLCTPTLPITITENSESAKTFANQTSPYSIKKHQDKDLFHKQQKLLIFQAEKINSLLKLIKKCATCKQKLKQIPDFNDQYSKVRQSQQQYKDQCRQILKVKKLLQSKHTHTPSDMNQSSKEEGSKYPTKYKLKINRKKKEDQNNATEEEKVPLQSERNKSANHENNTEPKQNIQQKTRSYTQQIKKQHHQLLNSIQRLIQKIQDVKTQNINKITSQYDQASLSNSQKKYENSLLYKQLLEDTLNKFLHYFYKNSKVIEASICNILAKDTQALLKISQNDKEEELMADFIHDAKCYSIQREDSQLNFSSRNSNRRFEKSASVHKKNVDKQYNIDIKGFTTNTDHQAETQANNKNQRSPFKNQKVIDVDIAKLIYQSKKSNGSFKNGKCFVKPFEEKMDHDCCQTILTNCVPKGHNCRARTIVLQYTFDQFHRKNQQINILKQINQDLNIKLANLTIKNEFLSNQIKFVKEKNRTESAADFINKID